MQLVNERGRGSINERSCCTVDKPSRHSKDSQGSLRRQCARLQRCDVRSRSVSVSEDDALSTIEVAAPSTCKVAALSMSTVDARSASPVTAS
jgi:hypothetical protein